MRTWRLTTENRGQQAAKLVVEDGERRLVTHRVFGELGLLDLRVDGVAVERRRERRAVFEVRVRRSVRGSGAADVSGIRRGERYARGLLTRRARQRLAEIDVARLVSGRVGIREVPGDQLAAPRAHVEGGCVHTNVLIQIEGHGHSCCRRYDIAFGLDQEQSK